MSTYTDDDSLVPPGVTVLRRPDVTLLPAPSKVQPVAAPQPIPAALTADVHPEQPVPAAPVSDLSTDALTTDPRARALPLGGVRLIDAPAVSRTPVEVAGVVAGPSAGSVHPQPTTSRQISRLPIPAPDEPKNVPQDKPVIGIVGGDWPPVEYQVSVGGHYDATRNAAYSIIRLARSELRDLIDHPGGLGKLIAYLEKKVVGDIQSATFGDVNPLVGILQKLTQLAIQTEVNRRGDEALKQARSHPGTAFFLAVVYPAHAKVDSVPFAPGRAGLGKVVVMKDPVAYLYWVW